LHAQLLARLTENFLSADDGDRGAESGKELSAALESARPVIEHALEWWAITQPPADPPAAASYFHWVYRRSRAVLAHTFIGAETPGETATGRRDWTDVARTWARARAFIREYVPAVDVEWLDVRLLAEAQAASPAREPVTVRDPDVDYEVEIDFGDPSPK
jgi:hypothetical protein